MTRNWTQENQDKESTLHTHFLRSRGPNFHLFRSMISSFQEIVHFRIFPLTPMLTFQSATIFFTKWPIVKKSNHLYSTMAASILIKFGWDLMKTVGVAAFWNFQHHTVLQECRAKSPTHWVSISQKLVVLRPFDCLSVGLIRGIGIGTNLRLIYIK